MSANLHIEALAWLRFTKQMPLVATEVGRWHADVLGLSSRVSIEIEIKKSISDLRNDFKNKRNKHHYYAQGGGFQRTCAVPNYLYYLVPEVLAEKAEVVLRDQNPKYGLLWAPTFSFEKETNSLGYAAGKNLQSAKKATRLHDNPPAGSVIQNAMRRLSSELVGLYQSHERLELDIMHYLEEIRANVRASAAVMAAFTPEPPDPDYTQEDDDETQPPHQDSHQ
jgi:hypothetical protein